MRHLELAYDPRTQIWEGILTELEELVLAAEQEVAEGFLEANDAGFSQEERHLPAIATLAAWKPPQDPPPVRPAQGARLRALLQRHEAVSAGIEHLMGSLMAQTKLVGRHRVTGSASSLLDRMA